MRSPEMVSESSGRALPVESPPQGSAEDAADELAHSRLGHPLTVEFTLPSVIHAFKSCLDAYVEILAEDAARAAS